MWVVCPDKSLDIPVKVRREECLDCGKCENAWKEWLRSLPIVPSDAKLMKEKKSRKSGMCPRTRELAECNASKRYCPYNMVCADEHPRMISQICIKEANMFLVKNKDGKVVASKATGVRMITDLEEVSCVYEIRQMLEVRKSLVPVSKESGKEAPPPKVPGNFNKAAPILIAVGSELRSETTYLNDFIKTASEEEKTVRGLIVAQVYEPTIEIKLMSASPNKKKPTTAKTGAK